VGYGQAGVWAERHVQRLPVRYTLSVYVWWILQGRGCVYNTGTYNAFSYNKRATDIIKAHDASTPLFMY
jgi:hypothetical protein